MVWSLWFPLFFVGLLVDSRWFSLDHWLVLVGSSWITGWLSLVLHAARELFQISASLLCMRSRNLDCPMSISYPWKPFHGKFIYQSYCLEYAILSSPLLVLVRDQKSGPPPFLMPCCIGCSEIDKINRHLICSHSPHLRKKDLSRKRL